ncbi:MAG: hypothetical protein Ct9H300mP31_21470 [Acidimicrobiaceae bacterium]|nr:MAG: hypothetical protein Ct9H300mP31_21470 [Acidimicrobiaceae bacterium]
MTDTTTQERVSQRVPLWRDVIVLKWVTQVFLLFVVLSAMWFLANQAGDNLRARNINTDFDFLERPVDIQISEGIDTHPNTGGRALWAAMVNTLRLSIAGIFFATILGVIVGLARLSDNWLVRRIASGWVEVLRNIPLLVQMILYYSAMTAAFPKLGHETGPINGWLHVSNKGISMPRVHIADGFYQWAVVVLIGAAAAHLVRRHRQRIQDETGANASPILWALGTIGLFGLIGLFVHPAFSWLGSVFSAVADLLDSLPNAVPTTAVLRHRCRRSHRLDPPFRFRSPQCPRTPVAHRRRLVPDCLYRRGLTGRRLPGDPLVRPFGVDPQQRPRPVRSYG